MASQKHPCLDLWSRCSWHIASNGYLLHYSALQMNCLPAGFLSNLTVKLMIVNKWDRSTKPSCVALREYLHYGHYHYRALAGQPKVLSPLKVGFLFYEEGPFCSFPSHIVDSNKHLILRHQLSLYLCKPPLWHSFIECLCLHVRNASAGQEVSSHRCKWVNCITSQFFIHTICTWWHYPGDSRLEKGNLCEPLPNCFT